MNEFLSTLTDPSITFLRYALIAGLLASVAFGVIGSYVVIKRITYIAGAIAHCVLGGIGAALFFSRRYDISWLTPMTGAVIAALAAALIIGLISIHAQEREDSIISALWVTGMAAGIMFMARTPGYIDPMSYLFGNILMISRQDLWTIVALDSCVVTLGILFYNKMLAVCFDEEFARLRGVNTRFYYLLLLCLTALTIVLMIRIVGIVLVIALFSLPAAVAGQYSSRLWQMMIISTLLSMFYVTAGLAVSYGPNLPSGATIVMIAGLGYLLTMTGRLLSRKQHG
ncbi:MAG: hypothetical protein C0613_02625 [Desulfobulbaceae bacterium]|nr:MAG: hypothetical protein C0613_02625 [Desulfobulbaceae bacterium]